MPRRQIRVHSKHDDYSLDAATPALWACASLKLLSERKSEGYWYLTPAELAGQDAGAVALSDEQIEALPDEYLRTQARRRRVQLERDAKELAQYTQWYEAMERVVSDQDASILTGPWRLASYHFHAGWPKAWCLLFWRSEEDYEYEHVALENVR